MAYELDEHGNDCCTHTNADGTKGHEVVEPGGAFPDQARIDLGIRPETGGRRGFAFLASRPPQVSWSVPR
jgi:hypothetical protein